MDLSFRKDGDAVRSQQSCRNANPCRPAAREGTVVNKAATAGWTTVCQQRKSAPFRLSEKQGCSSARNEIVGKIDIGTGDDFRLSGQDGFSRAVVGDLSCGPGNAQSRCQLGTYRNDTALKVPFRNPLIVDSPSCPIVSYRSTEQARTYEDLG